jgi:tetratricopeptide (TPR) repeat protein
LTRQHGIPNACNRCHQDKNVDWALEWTTKWYSNRMDRPTRHRTQVIASARKGENSAREPLVQLLATEEIPYWRAVTAKMLERWAEEPTVTAALLRATRDTNSLVRANAARSLDNLAEAGLPQVREALTRLLEDSTRNVRYHAGWALRTELDLDSLAGRELKQTLSIVADQPVGQMQLGALALARRQDAQALQHYQKAVEWDANSAPIRHDYAVMLAAAGRSREAVEQLQAACRLESDVAEYHFKLALAWNEMGASTNTIAALQTAVRLESDHARAWYNLGLALDQAGRVEEALTALTRAETAAPADASIPYARATVLARLGRLEQARAAARRALEIQPGYAPAGQLLRQMQ